MYLAKDYHDPHIKMRTVRVMFADPSYNYETSINGTRAEIARYFDTTLNMASGEQDDMQKPIRIEFLNSNGFAMTAVMLADSSQFECPELFIGVFPTGWIFCDRSIEKHGDYLHVAFQPFDTLQVKYRNDCPYNMRMTIESVAYEHFQMSGQEYQVSTSGQTRLLGA